eukprot:gene8871-820_t
MSGQGQKRLQKELMKLQKSPEADTTITILNDNIFKWEVSIIGPKKTPYEGGYFLYNFDFPEEYPFHPPKVKSLQPVYHPSYDGEGSICIDILRKDEWSPMSGVRESNDKKKKLTIVYSSYCTYSIIQRSKFRSSFK